MRSDSFAVERFFGATALVLALLTTAGCSNDEEKSERPAASSSAASSPSTPAVPTSVLSVDRIREQWESEHIVFVLQRRWSRTWIVGLEDADDTPLTRTFLPDPQLTLATGETVLTTFPWGERSVLTGTESPAADASESLDPAAWIAYWRSLRARYLESPEVAFSIERLEPLAAIAGDAAELKRWRAHAIWSWRGQIRKGDDASAASLSRIRCFIDFAIDVPDQVDTRPVVQAWHLQSVEQVEAPRRWFEDLSEELRLDGLGMPENRTATLEEVRQYRFQMSLEDFDGDGRIDIALSEPDGPPVLLRNLETGRLRQVAFERGIIVDRAQGQLLCTWFDMDGDRDPDLLMGSMLLRNNEGLFEDITATSGLVIDPYCISAIPADYDLDGDVDLYFVYQRGTGPSVKLQSSWVDGEGTGRANELWRNEGNGKFTDVTADTGAGGGARVSNDAAWVLLDDDRYPDLYIANELARDVVLRNRGDGTFEDVTIAWGAEDYGISLGVAAGDVDEDGRNDLVVSRPYSVAGARIIDGLKPDDHNPKIRQRLTALANGSAFVRGRSNALEPEVLGRSLTGTGWSFAPAIADFDGDSHLDLAMTNGLAGFSSDRPDGASNFWQLIAAFPENRDGRAELPGELDGVAGEFWSEQPLRIVTERRNLGSFQRNLLAIGNGTGEFLDVSGVSGMDADSESRTIVPVDFDRDGHLDLFVGSDGGPSLQFLRNTLTDSNWIGIQLHGSPSNAYGLGSRIKIQMGDRTIVRDLLRLGSFLGAGPAELTIGLGEASSIDSVVVEWPSGKTTTVTGLEINRRWRLFEDETAPLEIPRPTYSELFVGP